MNRSSGTAQQFIIVWLDSGADELNTDDRNELTRLQQTITGINLFDDADRCVDYITEIQNQKVFFVVSCAAGQYLVPHIHELTQLDLVYVYCPHKCNHDQWIRQCTKIKGVFLEITAICESMKKLVRQYNEDSIAFSLVSETDARTRNLDELDQSFMYTQLFKEVMLQVQFDEGVVKQLTNHWRDQFLSSQSTLQRIVKFEQEYRQQLPIWWYTYESLLYEMLNRALRTLDVDIIMKMGFFLKDLHEDIKRLQSQRMAPQTQQAFTIYRGQGLSIDEFEQLLKTKGGLMSFNNFLSTTTDRDLSLLRAESNQGDPALIGVHFEMNVDPLSSSIPFAYLGEVSYYDNQESEILFSMHTVFRIGDIERVNDSQRLWTVKLTLTSDDDELLGTLTRRMRTELSESGDGWSRLGALLITLGHFDKAEKLYTTLMKQAIGSEKERLYNAMGTVKTILGNYEEALTFYGKSLEINRKRFSENHHTLADSYNNIGLAYTSIGQYSEALSMHQNALEIREKRLLEQPLSVAESYANIGSLYQEMGEYSKALSHHLSALRIFEKWLPPNHPSLATTYNNIGIVHKDMKEHSEALAAHEKALEIRHRTLPSKHPAFAESYRNMAIVYNSMGQHAKALLLNEKGLEILQEKFGPDHPDLAEFYINIGTIHRDMSDYLKAKSCYTKALEIFQKTSPPNSSRLGVTYNNMGMICHELGEYPEALSFFEKGLDVVQHTHPPSHPIFGTLHKNIGMTCVYMGDFPRAIGILRRLVPCDRPALRDLESLLEMAGSDWERLLSRNKS